MSRLVSIFRDGEELGAWPYDIVFALYRCGSLVATDTFLVEEMSEPAPLTDALPPSPSRSFAAEFLGRDDDESRWTFFCRDERVIIGPRPLDEILSLILVGTLLDEHLIFIAGGERWISVADFLRMLEKESPGIIEVATRMRELAAPTEQLSTTGEPTGPAVDWLERGLNLSMLSPHIGTAYLGFNALKRLGKWLGDGDTPRA
jgi:hypothetical protein